MVKPLTPNTLYYGDNLPILQQHFPDESVDLIYLDPPFNSNRSYNLLFKDESGNTPEAQITAFDDTWHWNATTESVFNRLSTEAAHQVSQIVISLREFIGTNQMMAYLVMMTARLAELHRVLKPTGSLYLHCDPTASHYLKLVLDAIFGPENFRNEIIWKRQSAHSDARYKFADVADIILFYVKSKAANFRPQYTAHDPEYVKNFYRFNDNDGQGPYSLGDMASPNPRPHMMYEWMGFPYPSKGWRYQLSTMQKLHDEGKIWYPRNTDGSFDFSKRPRLKRHLKEQEGTIISNVWLDIQPLHDVSSERLGYPTQKPLVLLERIINASSNPGDIVLDPFCGCGTAVAAAEKLSRRWVGIDITHLSISLINYRMKEMFPTCQFSIHGEPEDIGSARQLAQDDRYQFQWWALSLVKARPLGGDTSSKQGKKGSDRGIDGAINVIDGNAQKPKTVLVQVKSGHVKSGDIRDLVGTIQREGAIIGVFITLELPTQEMLREAASAGVYQAISWNEEYPRIQILTIDQLLAGAEVKMPKAYGTFKQAGQASKSGPQQPTLDLGL